MTPITFTYMAEYSKERNAHAIHLYVSTLESTWTDSPREERKAIQDAEQIVRDLVRENCDMDGDRLLRAGSPSSDEFPVFQFTIGVSWNRKIKLAHYSRVSFERVEMDGKWNPIAQLGMEQYEYTMSVLRKREKKEMEEKANEQSE